MDNSKRQQTTKGIWMCRARDMNILVMDVEGTDGRERGEDKGFERKSAVFSLASSEVLIFNLWDNQIGLYHGANMGLLKTVFEVNLGNSESDVRTLRGRFTDKSRNDFVFKPMYHKRVPADGISLYMQRIWEQVQSNKDLDLPTQQELVAQFRCDEIFLGALGEFNDKVKQQKQPIEAGLVIKGLGEMTRAWRSQALFSHTARYDREASRYHQGVYERKRADLIGRLDSTLSPLFLGQLRNLHQSALAFMKAEIDDDFNIAGFNFANIRKIRARAVDLFIDGAREAVVIEGDPTWKWEEQLNLLQKESRAVADQFRKDRHNAGIRVLTAVGIGLLFGKGLGYWRENPTWRRDEL
ncbi:RHD3/Sey1 [Lactifluus volemus]|nr:RHD3/Sey1 [Lactifluus volemus]